MLAAHEVANSKDAARAHIVRVQFDGSLPGTDRVVVIALHRMQKGQNRKRERRTGIEPYTALGKLHRLAPQFAGALHPSVLHALHQDGGEIGVRDRSPDRARWPPATGQSRLQNPFCLPIIMGKLPRNRSQALIGGRRPGGSGSFRAKYLRGQGRGQTGDDFILHANRSSMSLS